MATLPPDPSSPSLARKLGTTAAIAMVVGSVIGSGIFAKPGDIALYGGQFPLIIGAWVVGGLVCLFGALCMSELARMHPAAGGHYVYMREAYGKPGAFLSGWNDTLLVQPAANGALSFLCIRTLAQLFGYESGFGIWVDTSLAASIIVLLTTVNVAGVVWGGLVQTITTFIKAGFLLAFASLPIFLLFGSSEVVSITNFGTQDIPDKDMMFRLTKIFLAIMWAYNGWHFVTPVAEEIRDPQKNLSRALVGGMVILIILYVIFTLAMHSVMSVTEVASAGKFASQEAMKKMFPSQAGLAVSIASVVVIISTFSAVNAGLLVTPRVTYAMARDRVFFPSLEKIHPRYKTPARSIALQGIMAILLLLIVPAYITLLQLEDAQDTFDVLTDYSAFTSVVFYVMAVAAVMVLRWRQPDRERPYRVPGYPLIPIIFLVFNIWFLSQVFINTRQSALIGAGLILIAIPVYYLMRRRWL
ncbi:MAG: amino acid permease [Planctomycetota bacterium]|nr:amino acid permease [Planctomycetota bacterium]